MRQIALVVVVVLGGCSAPAASQTFQPAAAERLADGALRVRAESLPFLGVETAGAERAPAIVRAPGRVAFREGAVAQIGPPIEGRATIVHARVGERVAAGDPLVTIVSSSAATTRGELAGARVLLRAAETERARQTEMSERGVGLASDRARAEADVAQSRARVAALSASVSALGRGAAATVVVRSPIAGTVLDRRVSVGQALSAAGDALVVVGEPDALWVVAEVFERELPLVRAGATAHVRISSISGEIEARVETVGGAVDTTTRRAPVYLSLGGSVVAGSLRAGMSARASIEVGEQGISIPATSVLVKEGGRTVVFVARDERTFVEQEVDVGGTVDGRVPVLAGLVPGARVVTRGALLLDGTAGLLR